jgi:hypothetical protein
MGTIVGLDQAEEFFGWGREALVVRTEEAKPDF